MAEKMTAKRKRFMQENGVKFGCYCDLELDQSPDDCVKDYDADGDCAHAPRHKTREGCPFWRPLKQTK